MTHVRTPAEVLAHIDRQERAIAERRIVAVMRAMREHKASRQRNGGIRPEDRKLYGRATQITSTLPVERQAPAPHGAGAQRLST